MRGQDASGVIHAPDRTLDSVGNVGDVGERAVLTASRGARESYTTGLAVRQSHESQCGALLVTPAKYA